MKFHSLLFSLCVAEFIQQPFISSYPKIAIIGAGPGGASCSYYLSKTIDADITVFEKNDYIGGRSTVVYVHDDPLYPVELGASIFVEENHILVEASQTFNLSVAEDWPSTNGVWDGHKFLFTFDDSEPSWKIAIKLAWKYGISPLRVQNNVRKVISAFLKLYDAPFTSLTLAAKSLTLDLQTGTFADSYLLDLGVSREYSHDIIQSATRCNYAQNLDKLQALAMLVCMVESRSMNIEGGNRLIFENMIKASKANLKLNTRVKKIEKNKDKWMVDGELFDQVVIATPIKQSELILPSNIQFPEIEYVELYVTLVSTRSSLNATTFGSSPPKSVFTTTSSSTPWFNSVSVVQSYKDELVWKIFSPKEVTESHLAELFAEVTWIYKHKWFAYPKLDPRTDFGKIEVEKGLWWINGMEGLISTMETSALMGRNIASLIASKNV